MAEPRRCCICGGVAQFFAQIVVGTLGVSPKALHNGKSIAFCDRCCDQSPRNFNLENLRRVWSVELWMKRNELLQKIQAEPDSKTKAAGASA